MAYDARRSRAVMTCNGQQVTETWEWDGTAWFSTSPLHRPPPPNSGRRMSFDLARGRSMLLDGTSGELWEWDGFDWTEEPRNQQLGNVNSSTSIAYDGGSRRTVIYNASGGRYAQWFASDPAPEFAAFGSGCGVAPAITASGLPWLGDTVTLGITPLAASHVSLLATGFSLSSYQGTPLPHSLQPYGWPGCALQAGPDVVQALIPSGGAASVAFTLPVGPAFLGIEYAQQVLSWNPATAGLSTTSGYRTRLGRR